MAAAALALAVAGRSSPLRPVKVLTGSSGRNRPYTSWSFLNICIHEAHKNVISVLCSITTLTDLCCRIQIAHTAFVRGAWLRARWVRP